MELTEREKALIQLIHDDVYTEEYILKYWKKKPEDVEKKINWSLTVMKIKQVDAFMTAIVGIERILEDREHERNNSA